MQQLRQLLVIGLFVLFFVPFSVQAADFEKPATNIDMQKKWTIHFNQEVTETTVNQNTVYVLNSKEEKLAVNYEFTNDHKSLVVLPPANGYMPAQTYTLVVTNGVKSGNKILSTPVEKPFTIKEVENALVITKQSGTTNLYTEPTLTTKAISYVATSSAFDYIEANEQSIAINVAGVTRYIAHKDARVTEDLSTQNYYQVSADGLIHYVYNYTKKRFEWYVAGAAPAFLKSGTPYTSADGATFKDDKGQIVGESYQYFQYLSPRTKTAYTAEQLDAYIDAELASRKLTNSKLTGIGTHFKQVEKQYGLNALFLLAFAQHETSFGMSEAAQKYNNLFGIKIYDSGEQSDSYQTPQDSAVALAEHYLNKNYIPANAGEYANGVAPGNKYIGFNVSYASDPYWGAKIAGHMYTIDKKLGQLDHKQYQIGLIKDTSASPLHVRPIPGNTIAAIYSIRNPFGKPLTITDSVTNAKGEEWYKLISDDLEKPNAYTFSQNVRIIDTH